MGQVALMKSMRMGDFSLPHCRRDWASDDIESDAAGQREQNPPEQHCVCQRLTALNNRYGIAVVPDHEVEAEGSIQDAEG